jgi:arsenical pump membrane protein
MSNPVVAVLILVLTVSLSLRRPHFWNFQVDHAGAAVLGALACIAVGLVSISDAAVSIVFLLRPVVTIASLMTITLIAEDARLFTLMSRTIAKSAGSDARKLFALLFILGAVTGTVFTNDAAVLIFTPLVFLLIEEVAGPDWTLRNKLPFYFAILYVANVGGAFIISNPINIVASEFFGVRFLEYAKWMFIPAIVSIIVSYIGLRIFFRKDMPETFQPLSYPTEAAQAPSKPMLTICILMLVVTLLALFTQELTGFPTWVIVFVSALILAACHQLLGESSLPSIMKKVAWDELVFVVSIFIVVAGIRATGLTAQLAGLFGRMTDDSFLVLSTTMSLVAGTMSAMMNNHPTVDTMAMVIQEMNLPLMESRLLLYSALIGGDLGPKMIPIGSLAALIWFRLLRDRGVNVSYWTYVKVGVPVSLAAIILAVITLNIQVWIRNWLQ